MNLQKSTEKARAPLIGTDLLRGLRVKQKLDMKVILFRLTPSRPSEECIATAGVGGILTLIFYWGGLHGHVVEIKII